MSGTLMRARTEPQADTRRASASPSVGASGVHYVKKSGRKSLDSAMQLGPRDEAEAEAPGDEAGTSSSAAPSAALVAAVQKAAKAAKPETLNFSPALSNRTMHSPFLVPEELPEGLVGRRRWASMTEEEMMTGIRRSSKEMHPVDLAAYPSPGMSPTLAPTWRVGRDAADTYGPGARRRWASLSDDEAASPMLWPMRSPALHVQRPGRRSQSNTPLLGPAGMGLAKVSEHAECEDFMLPPTPPVATPSDRQGPNMSPTSQGKNMPMTPENYPMAWPNWDPNLGVMAGFPEAPAWPNQMWFMPRDNGVWPQVPGYVPGMTQDMGGGPGYPPVGNPFGWMPMPEAPQMWLGEAEMPTDVTGPWMQFEDGALPAGPPAANVAGAAAAGAAGSAGQCSLVWIGERAFRAQANEKEELENLGFTVKIYRTHDRCSRVLDKKSTLAATTVFLLSEAEASPMLEYLQKRGASGLRVLVEAEGYTPEQAWEFNKSLPTLEDSCAIRVCGSWEEVAAALLEVCQEAMYMGASASVAKLQTAPAPAPPKPAEKTAVVESKTREGENPWTLVWISDQAFKPTAVSLKTQLESLGCQVKGYKTHKNAARALDKKRGLVRTVVMVTAAEALPFLQYLQSRPELLSTPVVVEATSRGFGSLPKSPNVQVCDSFDSAAKAVWTVAHEPGFG